MSVNIGTWVPEVSFGGESKGIEYLARYGTFYQADKLVIFSCYVAFSSIPSDLSGDIAVTGLPYTNGGRHDACSIVPLADISPTDPIYSSLFNDELCLYNAEGYPLSRSAFANGSCFQINGTFIMP